MTQVVLDSFTTAYIEAALWSSTDDNDQPLDENYGVEDIAPIALEKIILQCSEFQAEMAETLDSAECTRGTCEYSKNAQAGHDFWLTRNGHGAGFWDGDWSESATTLLTAESKKFGECDIYVGDDGKLYI